MKIILKYNFKIMSGEKALKILNKVYKFNVKNYYLNINWDKWLISFLEYNYDECGEECVIEILKGFKKDKKDKNIILEDIKKQINDNKKRLFDYNGLDVSDPELISLLIFFGLDYNYVNEKNIENYLRYKFNKNKLLDETFMLNNFLEVKKIIASYKIVNFIEERMDDENELKPMRMLINLRKFNDIMEKK